MKFYSLINTVTILLFLDLLILETNSMHSNTKKTNSQVFDSNYSHFASSILSPNYSEGILTNNIR